MQPRTHHRQRASQGRVAAWGWWALKWMMVLLMIVDQVGSPLHRHHHDSGVDAAHVGASSGSHHDHVDAATTHVNERDHHEMFAHSTLAVRQAVSSQLSVAPTAADDGQFTWILISSVLAFLSRASVKDKRLLRPFARWRAPCKTIYRSLPPAGRAPPLHA